MKSIEELKAKRDKLNKKIEALENPELEVGEWYRGYSSMNSLSFIILINGLDKTDVDITCGVWGDGDWMTGGNFDNSQESNLQLTPATKEEVETALIKEAKRRGFKKGVKFTKSPYNKRTPSFKTEFNINEGAFAWDRYRGYGLEVDQITIFLNGQWAEIIEDKVPEVNGYKLEKISDYNFKFGCAEFKKRRVKEVFDRIDRFNEKVDDGMNGNRKIKSIILDIGVEITVEKLKEIVDYLDK